MIQVATGEIGGADIPRGDEINGFYAVLVTFLFLYAITQILEWSMLRKAPNAAATFILSKFQNRGKGWAVTQRRRVL